MLKKVYLLPLIIAGLAMAIGCGPKDKLNSQNADTLLVETLEQKVEKYVPVQLTYDIQKLSEKEQQLIAKLIDAADIMDELYWIQAYGDKAALLDTITNEHAQKFVMINYGPWDRLDGNAPFLEGAGEKPKGANFYPADMTEEEFEALGDPNKTSLYTMIRRDEEGNLIVIWYHDFFAEKLQEASKLLKEAAELAEDAGFKKYLNMRADALLSSDYFASDIAWMDMKESKFDFVYGPIENYEDRLFEYKAAFESFILIKDLEWSEKLALFNAKLPSLQKELPADAKYLTDKVGLESEINVYDVIYYAGDCNAGSKTIAINLPNDVRVHAEKGTRKLQLKNAMQAKFDKILVPISNQLIVEEQRKYIKFNAFFENTMFHEVAHGMGVKNTIHGETARAALTDAYSTIEEGKADIVGLWLVTKFYESGELNEGELMDNYVTFFAGIFRSMRFGITSSHGKANMIRFNYFAEHGAFERTEEGQYRINFEKMQEATLSLAKEILTIQGEGDKAAADKMIEEMAVIKPELQGDLDKLKEANIPTDIVFEKGKEVLGL